MRIALLSNVNIDFILGILAKKLDCVPSVGYGNVWGQLLNPASELNAADPDLIVFIMDIEQLVDGSYDLGKTKVIIDEWYSMLDSIICREKDYFISDVMFRSNILTDNDSFFEYSVVRYWMDEIQKRVSAHSNIHILGLNTILNQIGKNRAFSNKMWYMGKIPYTNEGCRLIADTIESKIGLFTKAPKKVLVLDLDNTIWGGVLGELGVEGIALSDESIGAIYKKVQEQINAIKNMGIILAIVSKNNESDVDEVWKIHPHMLLRREDFVSVKINWVDKAENIIAISKELNLGTDSFVFIDDTASERDNIKRRIPGVAVPDFPDRIEDYPGFIERIYDQFFKRIRLSAEDKVKTKQYSENAKRAEAAKGMSYEEFLTSLEMKVERVELNDAKLDRIAQMHSKTNQFNLTTIRYTRQDIDKLLSDGYKVYAFNVKDKFGDYGLVAVAIVDCNKAVINSFLMSCRIMGKLIENYVIDQVEMDAAKMGHTALRAKYIKTAKNAPVEKLFDGLGYTVVFKNDKETEYEIELKNRPERKYFVNRD